MYPLHEPRLAAGIAVQDCGAAWRDRWVEFWAGALPRYDHVLMWAAPKDVLELVPAAFESSSSATS
jgi:hypothetical protein